MSDALLLDTHIALWLDSGDARLRPATRAAIDRSWQGGGSILLSTVTVWEIALLVDAERIVLDLPVRQWVERFLTLPGVTLLPLDHLAAARAYELHPLEHRDPADRLLMATAIEHRAPLVTYDERIARFAERYGRRHGLSVIG